MKREVFSTEILLHTLNPKLLADYLYSNPQELSSFQVEEDDAEAPKSK